MHKLFEQVENSDSEGVRGKEIDIEDDSLGAGEEGPVQGRGPVLPGRLGHCGRAQCCHQGSSGGVEEEKQRYDLGCCAGDLQQTRVLDKSQ